MLKTLLERLPGRRIPAVRAELLSTKGDDLIARNLLDRDLADLGLKIVEERADCVVVKSDDGQMAFTFDSIDQLRTATDKWISEAREAFRPTHPYDLSFNLNK
jgi:hypothetical protein